MEHTQVMDVGQISGPRLQFQLVFGGKEVYRVQCFGLCFADARDTGRTRSGL